MVLDVEHLTVASKLHKNNAVRDVSFRVRAGEIVCIAGIDGNGQTELVYGITGLEKPVGGKIFLDGEQIHGSDKRIGMVDERLIIGKVYMVIYPLSEFGVAK